MSEAPKRARRRRDQQSLAPLLALCLIALVIVVLLGFYLGTLPGEQSTAPEAAPEAAPEVAPEPEAELTCATFVCPEMYTKKADAASIAKHTQAECCDPIGANECPSGSDGSGTCVPSGTGCSDPTKTLSIDGTCRYDGEECSGNDANRLYTWTGTDELVCTLGDCKEGFGEDAQDLLCRPQGGECTYTGADKITNGVYQWQENSDEKYECMFHACASDYTYDSATATCEAPPASCGGALLVGADTYYTCNSAFSNEDECNACPLCKWCNPGSGYDGWGCYDSRLCS